MNKRVTIYTLAEDLDMSVSAVSRAFNPNSRLAPDKRKLILEAAKKAGYRQNKVASRLSQDTIHIGVLMYKRIDFFCAQLLNGIDAACSDFQSYKLSCDIRSFPMEKYNSSSAYAILDEFKNAHYDGVVIHGIYSPTISKKINELVESGLKVVTLQNDIPESRRLFTSALDTEVAGAIVAQLFDMVLPKTRRNVIYFSGNMISSIHQGLFSSYTRHADEYNLKLLKHYDTADQPRKAEKMVAEAFARYPEVNAVYISSSNSVPICKYIEEHGLSDKVFVIASDVFEELEEFMQRDVVNATIYQSPFSQGYFAVENLYYSIAESREIPEKILAHPKIVLTSNLSYYM